MSKFLQIVLVASLAIALCAAEAPRLRSSVRARFQNTRRNRFLARQELAVDAAPVTPYPSADELRPAVPFDEVDTEPEAEIEPEEAAVPALAPAAPAGPAAAEIPIGDEEDLAPNQPDLVYGPPENEVDQPLPNEIGEDEINADLPATVEQVDAAAPGSARFTTFRRSNGFRRNARPAKLRAAPKAQKARFARLQQAGQLQPQTQTQFLQQPLFFYSAQLQSW